MMGLLDAPKNTCNISAGAGNGTFSQRLYSANAKQQSQSKIYYNASAGFYHKFGAGITGGISMVDDKGKFVLFQGYISPSYDYRNRKISTGVAYYRYFNKDDLSFYVSPLVNEVYGYFTYKKGWLIPKLVVDYGWGSSSSVLADSSFVQLLRRRFPRRRAGQLQVEERVNDFSLVASVKHNFFWSKIFSKKDDLLFAPSVSLVAGTSRYGTNLPLGSIQARTQAQQSLLNYFARKYNQSSETGFRLQALNIILGLDYMTGNFYIQPNCMFSYSIPKDYSMWHVNASVSLGVTF